MSRSKAGWSRVALGDVVEVVADYWDRKGDVPERFIAGEHIDEGDLTVRRWGMTSDDNVPPTFNRKFRAGDVLFHSRNLKKLACPAFGGITGEKIFVLRSCNEMHLLPSLLPYLLQTTAFHEYVTRMWSGSTNKFLNKAPLVKCEISLPPPNEQVRIVALLQSVASIGEALHDAAEASNRLPNAIISDFLRRTLGSDEPMRFRSRHTASNTRLGRAGDVLRARQGLQIVQTERLPKPGRGLYPYLTVQHLIHGGAVEYVPASSSRVVCTERDVLIVRTGMTNGEVFTGAVGVFHNNLFAVDYDDGVLERDFIVAYLRHPQVRRLMRALSGATNIPDLNHGDFYSIPFPIPSLAEQRSLLANYARASVAVQRVQQRKAEFRDLALTATRAALEV